jgi:DMSO reductase family type II enzyme heme b subunit
LLICGFIKMNFFKNNLMRHFGMAFFLLLASVLFSPFAGGMPSAYADEQVAAPVVTGKSDGKAIYEKRCSNCHGMEGRGDGPGAGFFRPRPTNFVRGQFKYASTIKGALPTDEDLFKTVSKGLSGTGMPAWESVLSESDRKAVIAHVKTFSKKFADQKGAAKLIDFGKKISSSKESITKGKELFFKKADCARCHGVEGRADGPNAKELSVWPRNLTKGWLFRRSNAPEEIFQRITRGIIVMPSFAKGETVETTEEERWHIANYVHSLSQYEGSPTPGETIVAERVDGALTDNPDDPIWQNIDKFYFPMVGQVVIEPRQFTPTIDSVIARAIYNDKEVALLLTWDDATKSLVSEGAEGDDLLAVSFPSVIRDDERPYFIMGTPEYPVYVARLNAADSIISELTATGQEHNVGIRLSPQGANEQQFMGKTVYKNGQYRAVFKRALSTPDKADLQFKPMQFVPIAFSAWDGSNGDVDSKRSISAWYYLLLKPPDPPTRYIYPTIFALLVVGLEFWIIRRYRNKKGGQ